MDKILGPQLGAHRADERPLCDGSSDAILNHALNHFIINNKAMNGVALHARVPFLHGSRDDLRWGRRHWLYGYTRSIARARVET